MGWPMARSPTNASERITSSRATSEACTWCVSIRGRTVSASAIPRGIGHLTDGGSRAAAATCSWPDPGQSTLPQRGMSRTTAHILTSEILHEIEAPLAATVAAMALSSTAGAANPTPAKNVVLVHGGFVDGSGWQRRLRHPEEGRLQRQHRAEPDDLAGRRRRRDQARHRRSRTARSVLVGHSYGGVVDQRSRHRREGRRLSSTSPRSHRTRASPCRR